MNPLNLIPPQYRILIKPLCVLLLVVISFITGIDRGVRISQYKVTAAQTRANNAATALRAAADRLTADAALFRRINDQVAADVKRAAAQRKAAEASAARAASETARLRRTLSGLEHTLRSERATCTDGSKPICGVPLQ